MSIKDSATAFEAVMVSMSKTAAGTKMIMVIHHDDDVSGLFSRPVGSRYQVALVELDDQNLPKEKPETADGSVVSAGILCRSMEFQAWVALKGWEASEDAATKYIHWRCGIKSRAELRTNEDARYRFQGMRREYNGNGL